MTERRIAVLVLVLAGYLCFGGLGARSIENKDISRTAEIARETLESGRWLAPTREGELETEKPPLYIWVVAGLGSVTGRVGALESRLPAAAASYATVLLVFFWVSRRKDVPTAAVAAGFLATGQIFLELARISRVDALFAFLLAISVLLARAAEKKPLGRQLLLSSLSGVALAASMLTKSPLLGVVLHLASVGGWYIVDLAQERPWRELRESPALTILRRFLAPPASLPPILACALFACWLIPFKNAITAAEWEAAINQFKFENTERGVTGSDKPKALWFYVPVVLFRAAPGALLAFIFIRRKDAADREAHRFAQCWWFFPFLVLSIAAGKDSRYILPCLPGLAVAGALNWSALASSDAAWVRGLERAIAWLVFGVAALGAVALPVGAALRIPEVLGDACWLALVSAAAAGLALRTATTTPGRPTLAVAPLLLAVFAGEAAYNVVVLPAPTVEAPRVVVKHVAEALPKDLKLADLVLFQVPKQGTKGESRQRRTRILLALYRNEKVPPIVTTPEAFLAELSVSEKRRGLVDAANWDGLAPIVSSLEVEELALPVDKHDERFRLVRRLR